MRKIINNTSALKEVKRGETFYPHGSYDSNIYILKKGVVKINILSHEGRALTIAILKGGTIFGEMTDIDNIERNETAEVVEDGLMCIIKKSEFNVMLKTVPELSSRFKRIIRLRKWKIESKLFDLIHKSVKERLAKTIVNLLDDFGVPDNDSYILKLRLTHHDFSELIASTKETTTATLNNLKKEGIIDYEEKYLRILNIDKLDTILKKT
jgi:CRP/FNR family transcriptional regulator